MKNKVLQYAKMVKTIMTPLKFQVNEEKPPNMHKMLLRYKRLHSPLSFNIFNIYNYLKILFIRIILPYLVPSTNNPSENIFFHPQQMRSPYILQIFPEYFSDEVVYVYHIYNQKEKHNTMPTYLELQNELLL